MKKFKEFLKVKKNLQIAKKPKYGYRKIKKCLAPCLIAFSMVVPNFSASATEKNLENNGWIENSVGWWYQNSDGTYPANEWSQINGEWYWFDSQGYMQTGWKEIAGIWYYFNESGKMAHDTWIDGTYYVTSNGSMLTNGGTPDGYMVDENGAWIQEGWQQNSVGWWYKCADGTYPANEWKQINGEWYWFDESGYMQTGWQSVSGTWYYFTESGSMAHDTWIDGTYYVASNGSMLTNTITPDGYMVDENGAWIKNYYPNYPSINDKVKEEYVDIEDSKLLKVINKNISKDRADGQKVTKEEMENLKELSIFLKEDGSADFSENANESILGTPRNLKDTADFKFMVSRGIKSIKGLEYAKNLEKLKINENEISDITPLKNLTKLKYLEIQRNRITDVSALKDLKKLEFLKLYNNLITDVTPLAGLTNLTGLDLHFNVKQTKVDGKKVSSDGITDISCLKDLKKLTFLDVSANNISNVDVILNFSNLKDLDFSGNKVNNYSKIADFITPRIVKQLNEAYGSCGFFGQTVSLDKEVEVNKNTVTVKSPFVGIKEFGTKLKDAFEADEDVNIFTNVTTDKKGIEASYDVEKNEFNFNFSDEFLEQNKNKEVITNLKLEYNGWQWNLNNVKFNVKEKKETKKLQPKEEEKAVDFEDENLKNTLLTMFKNYDGKDGLSDTIEGEYEFKLKDPNYRINKNATELYEKDLEQIEALALRGFTVDENFDQHPYEFKSIVELEKAKNLKQLTISSGNIPEEGSEDFKNKIYYSKGSFSDLAPIKNLKNLELLRLSHNNIEDISILKELSNLKHLYLSHNKIKDISPLKTLKNLESLDISKNNVENPDIIKNFKNLRLLALRDSNISNLNFLKELTSLESLTAGENKISDISILKNLTNLKELYIDKNNIFDFSILKNLKKLTTSTLGNQEIESNLKIDVKEKTFEIKNPINIEDVTKEGEKITLTTDNKDIKAEFDKDKNVLKVTLDDEILKQKQVKFNINIEFTNKFPFYGDYSKENITLKNIILNIKKEDEKLSLTDKQKEFYFELFNDYNKFDKKYKYLTDDANKNFIKDKKPKLDKNFAKEDFKMLKTFSISKENVTDELIEPLKYAENLEEFSVLLNNGKLKREVTDFSFLKNTPKLKKFYYANQDYKHDNKEKLEKIDFSNNKNLKDVRITNTDLKNLNLLKGLDLNSLSFEDNEISDISSIKEMKNLERIDLDNNKIESLGNNLDNCQNLITLYLRDNPIEDISFLGKLKNLEALHLRNTNIKDISILKKLPNLHRLYIDKCKKLPKDYFNIVKELKGINTLFVSNITKEDFEWLKTFAIRDKVDASFDEDKIRLIGFENLSIDISVKKTDIVNNKIIIDNPLKDFDGNFVEDAGDERGENKDLKFLNDKIEITLDPTQTEIPKKYSMYLEDYNNTFGDYSQPANISGSITLNVVIK